MDTPSDLGLPFTAWREHQGEAVEWASRQDKKVLLIEGPTGCGKSGIAVGIARMLGIQRTCVLTSTKQLQWQYLDTFSEAKMVMGRGNFPCLLDDGTTADDGQCGQGIMCMYKASCPYFLQKQEALEAEIAVLNYSYFLPEANYVHGFSNLGLLVCDEGHSVETELSRFVSAILTRRGLYAANLTTPQQLDVGMDTWRDWAGQARLKVSASVESMMKYGGCDLSIEDRRMLKGLVALNHALSTIAYSQGEWVVQEFQTHLEFRPVWVSGYGELLLKHAEKVLIMSGTILDAESFLDVMLGIPAQDAAFLRMPSTFPASHRPVFYWPAMKLNSKVTNYSPLIGSVKTILDKHVGEKGIIHTSNYRIAEVLYNYCSSDRIRMHTAASRQQALEEFKQSQSNAVLLSPSMTQGLDLPYESCTFQIIAKLPFPDLGDEITKRRMLSKKGQTWYTWITACNIVQACGRGMRAKDDLCATYILDANFGWFLNRNRSMFPAWFLEALEVEEEDFQITKLVWKHGRGTEEYEDV